MTAPLPQTRTVSLIEAATNVIAGYVLALAVQRLVYPLFGIDTTLTTDSLIALIFTAASLLRSYFVRRIFVAVERHRLACERERLTSLERRLATGRLRQGRSP
jgi:hypothetical protein